MWLRIKQPYNGVSPTVSVTHNGPPTSRMDGETVKEYSLRLQSRLTDQIAYYDPANSMHLHIVDRCHLGSYVYGNLFRQSQSVEGWGELGRDGFTAVDRAYAAKGAVLAILSPSPDTLVERSGSREDEYLDQLISDAASDHRDNSRRVQQIIQIAQMYGVFIRQHALSFATYTSVGHPYYVPRDHAYGPVSEAWPDVAFDQDKRTIAADILGKAIDAQLSVMSSLKIVAGE